MGNSNKNKNSLKTMIQTKSFTLQAACLAYANALALQSKLLAEAQSQDIFDDIADWTVGAADDIGDWEGGWDMFTDPNLYYGEGWETDPEGCYDHRDREYQEAMRKQAEYCAAYNPKVNQPQPGSRYTITDDFNYQLMKARVPFDSVYAPLGDLSDPNHKMI